MFSVYLFNNKNISRSLCAYTQLFERSLYQPTNRPINQWAFLIRYRNVGFLTMVWYHDVITVHCLELRLSLLIFPNVVDVITTPDNGQCTGNILTTGKYVSHTQTQKSLSCSPINQCIHPSIHLSIQLYISDPHIYRPASVYPSELASGSVGIYVRMQGY
jgi:hypothetical protein